MSNLSSRLEGRRMPHKDVPICLDLELLDRRDEAMKAVSPRRVDEARMVQPAQDASAVVAELEALIREASIILRVYGVDRHTYNQWLVDCPPRKGRQEPFNSSTFFIHAAKQSAKYVDEAGVEHDITDDEWVTLDKMTDGEYDRLASAVLHVNRGVGAVDVGFFVNGSETTTGSSGISGSHGASASRPAGSGGGSRKKSTSKK